MAKKDKKLDSVAAKSSAPKTTAQAGKTTQSRIRIKQRTKRADARNHSSAVFSVNKVYLKNASVYAPGTPMVFKAKEKPTSTVSLKLTKVRLPGQGLYEAIIGATATIKVANKVAAIIKVAQSGIFTIANVSPAQLRQMLENICPNILLPYVRNKLVNMAVSAGFPPLNFKASSFHALPKRIRVRGASVKKQNMATAAAATAAK